MAATQGIRAGRAFVEVGVSDKLTAGLKRAQKRLKAFGDGVRSIGQKLVVASAVALAPLATSGTVFAGFEQRMARVQALSGAAGKDFRRLSDEAKRLGETTVFSASQAADAMSFFALAGFDVDQILKAIGPTLNMAAAGQLEIAQAADIAAKIMAGMGIEAEDLGGAVDVLTRAMTTANTDLQMLGDAMKYIGPIAKSAGLEFEEVVGAIQLLSNAGIQGDMAGTTLRGALLALTSPSKEAREQLEELGVSVLDAEGNVRPLADIIGDLNRAMAGMGSGKRLEILGNIFQARQAAGVAELLSQGADKLRDYTAALRESGGTAARIADVQLNTLQGDATILKSALEGLAIAVGDALAGPLRVVTTTVIKAVGAFAKWVRENRDLVVMFAAAVLAVGALGAGLVTLGVAAQVAAFLLGGLGSILAGIKIAMTAMTAALGAMLSPIGLVITAIAALGTTVLIYSGAAGEALDWLKQQFGRLRSFVSKVVTGISDALAAGDSALAAKILWLSLKLAWQQGVAALNRVWLEAKQFFIGTAQKMWYGALATAETVWHGLEVAWIETTAFLSKTWTNFTSDIKEAWHLVQTWLTKRWIDAMKLFGRLTEEQARAAKEMADEDFADTARDIEEKRTKAIDTREARRRREREQARTVHEAALAEIGRQFEEAQQALERETGEKVAQTRRALEEARRKLDEALAEARRKREEAEAADGAGPKRLPVSPLKELEERIAELGDVVAGKISVVGTFNPAALQGLGGGDAMERTARATEQTAKHTKRLADAAATGGLTFA